jgi:hypothetical protein
VIGQFHHLRREEIRHKDVGIVVIADPTPAAPHILGDVANQEPCVCVGQPQCIVDGCTHAQEDGVAPLAVW